MKIRTLLLTVLAFNSFLTFAQTKYIVHEVKGEVVSKSRKSPSWTALKHLSGLSGTDSVWVKPQSALTIYNEKGGAVTIIKGNKKDITSKIETATNKNTAGHISSAVTTLCNSFGGKTPHTVSKAVGYRGDGDDTVNRAIASAIAGGTSNGGIKVTKVVSPESGDIFSLSIKNTSSGTLYFSVFCIMPDGNIVVPRQMASLTGDKMPEIPANATLALPELLFVGQEGQSILVAASTEPFEPAIVSKIKTDAPAETTGAPSVYIGMVN